MKYSEKLFARYKEEIEQWNFDRLTFYVQEGFDGDFYESSYIDTVFGLTPSGKVYTFWTTNQTARDVIRDRAWWQAFEEVLESLGYWHDGDSGDIFITRQCKEWVQYTNAEGEVWNDRIYPVGYFAGEPDDYEAVPCDALGNEL